MKLFIQLVVACTKEHNYYCKCENNNRNRQQIPEACIFDHLEMILMTLSYTLQPKEIIKVGLFYD